MIFEIANLYVDLFIGFGLYMMICVCDASLAEIFDEEPSRWNKLIDIL